MRESGREGSSGGDDRRCLVCNRRQAVVARNLCEECAAEIAGTHRLVPEQIASNNPPGAAALIDQWGRPHYLVSRTHLGRRPPAGGIVIIDSSVSRVHAEATVDGGEWRLHDLASTNGTAIGDQRIDKATLASGDRIAIGSVGFYFIDPADEIRRPGRDVGDTVPPRQPTPPPPPPAPPAPSDDVDDESTIVGMQEVPMSLIEPTGGGGGYLQVGDNRVQLTTTQLELIRLLVERMVSEEHQPDLVRGFVHSSELLAHISWDTAHPTDNHVKQLVRRVRRALVRAQIGNLIESRHRFGYRLRVMPILSP